MQINTSCSLYYVLKNYSIEFDWNLYDCFVRKVCIELKAPSLNRFEKYTYPRLAIARLRRIVSQT